VHGDRYDYSNTEYQSTHQKVLIVCMDHGEFQQRATNHISGRGCDRCAAAVRGRKTSSRKQLGKSRFIEKSRQVWGDRYDYSGVEYGGYKSHVSLRCLEHDEVFTQTPNSHLGGSQGCPYCSSTNRGAGMVYLIEIHVPDTNEKFIKIGWTTSNVRTRFTKDEFEWKQLNRKMFPNAYLGERWERYMQNMFDDCRYKPKHSFSGETECFGYQYKELIQKTFAEEAKRGN